MKKIVLSALFALFPTLLLAANGDGSSGLSFAPPPSDYSVVFLGNIFGVVDGVLHGTGSQIMGSIFSVFNSAVLALGGIVIMYTLLVSTMNTAHEGQMLGQKWSSIWVPMRSTLGLALLIPKASGYCLMQIFVMWVVVQGVGAADKVWEAALGYLNRGGVIVQTQINPLTALTGQGTTVVDGASKILAGQVCMIGLQKALENQRQAYLNQKNQGTGPCSGTPSGAMKAFCNNAVPDFINSVNTVAYQNTIPTASKYILSMPNFDKPPYLVLNGFCGQIEWNSLTNPPPGATTNLNSVNQITQSGTGTGQSTAPALTSSEMQTAKMSRAIAIQQMYLDLSMVAQVMVNNDPMLNQALSTASDATKSTFFSPIAQQQFGIPYLASGTPCQGSSTACVSWGADTSTTNGSASAPLFSGTEFQGAIADYNGIMMPTLNLISQAKNASSASSQRAFIQQAETQGWLMAGSYFFDLARLNASSLQTANQTDVDSGLGGSLYVMDASISLAFGSGGQCPTSSNFSNLCQWLGLKNQNMITAVKGLVDGSSVLTDPLKPPTFGGTGTPPPSSVITGAGSATVYGFINNEYLVQLPGQPGLSPPQFAMKFNMNLTPGALYLPSQNFPCGRLKIMFFSMCLGQLMGDVFYNLIIRNIFNFFLNMMASLINLVVMAFLSLPLLGMAQIFKYGVAFIQQPSVNPVVALANMGVNYINFANELWIYLLGLALMSAIIPWFGIFIFPLLAMVMPLLFAWLGTMVSIGFITAYYIPFLPYMIFTFGSIAWLMAVIEAMVAAPIVALGITHPEGHDAFGKGESAIMILMNVFLRPAMMIIGYIAAISLSYVAVWIINAGFSNAMAFVQGSGGTSWSVSGGSQLAESMGAGAQTNIGFQASPNVPPWGVSAGGGGGGNYNPNQNYAAQQAGNINTEIGYTGWAGIYGFFFAILIYTTMYLVAVQKSFTLITYLPDKVLRWISGQQETLGQDATHWAEDEGKKQVGEAGGSTMKAAGQMDQQLQGTAMKYIKKGTDKIRGGAGGGASAEGGSAGEASKSTPEE